MNKLNSSISEQMNLPNDLNWELPEKEFQRFKDLVYQYSGINLTDEKRNLLRARLSKLIRKRGITSFEEYFRIFKNDNSGMELVELIDAVSTNVTSFFRENAHFEFLKMRVLPDLVEKNAKRIRFWSAACSTGEEPYSIIISVKPFLKTIDSCDFKLLASDISTKTLSAAKLGTYSFEKVNNLPGNIIQDNFTKTANGYQLKPDNKKYVTFARINLLEKYPFSGPFDVIFCRNVMIYFDRKTREKLINRLYDYLTPGGYLFIGHSENLSLISNSFKSVMPAVYQRQQ